MKKKYLFYFFFIAFFNALLFNLINIHYLKKDKSNRGNPYGLVHGGTIYSVDNYWYLTPAINFIEKDNYSHDLSNNHFKVRRTPGYPLFYGIHYYLFGAEMAHKVIGYTQSFIFALSAVFICLGVFNFSGNRKLATITGILYGSCPYVIGFNFYTTTESIYPAFVVFSFFAFSKYFKTSNTGWAIATGALVGMASLIRPTNILLICPIGLVLLVSLYNKDLKLFLTSLAKRSAFFIFGLVLILLPWTIRNYVVSNGDIVPLEKFYYESPMGMGRSQFYFSQWSMCFGNPRSELMFFGMQKANMLPAPERYNFINNFVNTLPEKAFSGSSRNEVFTVLKAMQDCYQAKKDHYHLDVYLFLQPGQEELACEFEVKAGFQDLISKYKKTNPVNYFLVSPFIIRGKEFFFQSFSSMYGSLNPKDGHFTLIQKIVKAGMYLLNVLLILNLIPAFFNRSIHLPVKIFCLSFILILFISLIFLVHVETRYLLGAYPFMIILLAYNLNSNCKSARRLS
jgi:4-amino-4-deoxy-L-arabinose transferase-like glycosyltransferase